LLFQTAEAITQTHLSTTLQLGSAKALGPELEDYYNSYILPNLVPTYSLWSLAVSVCKYGRGRYGNLSGRQRV